MALPPPAALRDDDNGTNHNGSLRIIKEDLCYSRYINVYNRVVELSAMTYRIHKYCDQDGFSYPDDNLEDLIMPVGQKSNEEEAKCITVDYDIVGSKTVSHHYCTVFPFNTSKRTVTLIKEYAQGANEFLYAVPTGGLSDKHKSLEDCIKCELSEEAHLRNGSLIKLIPDGHQGILEVKWCRNRFTPFLVLDPEKDPMPLSQDLEEIIEAMDVDLTTLKEIMYGGNMMLPSIVTCNMALNYLQEHKIII